MPDSVPPQLSLEPGAVLDRYELLCTIARGGMAHVWLGRFKGKHGFEKLVAVKTILPEHALDAHFRNMFLDEARIASGVEHPNVAKILDLGEWRDCLYLVMEYVDGDSLSRMRRLVEKRGLKVPLPIVLRIFADVCAGLHAAHELRGDDGAPLHVVHRDVSPQNVLIPTNGVAKLIDFGVAKARHRLGEETSAGFAKGKSRYMAPEQALAKTLDRRADVFAVAAMAYEVFEGTTPYDGPNDMARIHALITGDEVKKVEHAPHPAVEKLIVKALARDPEARFADANEMRAAIEDAMVALKVRASADDVAAFVVANTGDRIAERKGVLKVALDAAAERQRIKDVLAQGTVSGRSAEGSQPELSPPPSRAESAAPPAYSASVHEDAPEPRASDRRRALPFVAGGLAFFALSLVLALVVHAMRAPATDAARAPSASPSASPSSEVAASAPVTASASLDVASSNVPPPPPASATMTHAETDAGPAKHASAPRPRSTPRHEKNGHHPQEVVIQ